MQLSLKYLETVPEMFAYSLEKYGDLVRFSEKEDGEWKTYSFKETQLIVEKIALGLHALGYERGEKFAILSENCKEWTMTDLAAAHLGLPTVAIYPTLPTKQIHYILENSDTSGIVLSDDVQLDKIKEIKKDLPKLKYVIRIKDGAPLDKDWMISYADLLKKGKKELSKNEHTLTSFGKKIKKDDLWTIIYTSGTTGNPKGVMLSHFNICSNAQSAMERIKIPANVRFLSFLPLSHSFERIVSHGSYYCGAAVYFAESLDKIADNLQEVKPHYMFAVPRIFEKVYAKIHSNVAGASNLKKNIFNWAKKVGEATAKKYLIFDKKPRGKYAITYPIAKALALNKIKKILGGEFIYAVSGGAPLAEHIGYFFSAEGINILEGFGLTETSPVTHLTPPGGIKFGSVGLPILDVECMIAPDGEILIRGLCVMQGYYKNPLETKEAIDENGWFHTGDIGMIDEEGYLKITDRKKNIIVTAGGKNIAPAPIENLMLESKYIEQVVIIGDRRKYPIALIVPAREEIEQWAQQNTIVYSNYHTLLKNNKVYDLFEKELAVFQEQLARYEKSKKILLIANPFSIENEELTPSLKVRRNKVEEHYSKQIESLYSIDDQA